MLNTSLQHTTQWQKNETDINTTDLSFTPEEAVTEEAMVMSELPLLTGPLFVYYLPFLFLFTATGFSSTLLTIITFAVTKTLHDKPSNYLIINLAVADFSTIVTGIWGKLGHAFRPVFSLNTQYKYVCILYQWMNMSSFRMTLLGILLISIERLFAVTFPLKHKVWMTTKKVKIAIGVMWVMVCSILALPFIIWNHWQPGLPCYVFFFLPEDYLRSTYTVPVSLLILMALANIYTGRVAWKKKHTIHPMPLSADTYVAPTKSQKKITRMILKMVGVFYLLWAPFIVTTALQVEYVLAKKPVPEALRVAYEIAIIILGASFSTNTIIWAKESKEMREAVKNILCCKT